MLLLLLSLALSPSRAQPPPQPQVADIIVFGSTPAAIVAAVAAARANNSVVLVDTAQRLGGLMAGGLGFTDVGDAFAIGGLAREVFVRNARAYNASATAPLYQVEPHVIQSVFTAMLAEAGVRYARAVDATIAAATVAAGRLQGFALSSGASFSGAVFIDGSYEGDLIVAAGTLATILPAPPPARGPVLYAIGREDRRVYNESWAGRREPFGFPFDMRPISPLDASGALLPLLTARTFAPVNSGDALTQGYNFRLCAVKRSQSPRNFLPMPAPAPYNRSRWELLRRFAALPGVNSHTEFFSLGPLPGGAKYDMNNGCLISTDFTGASWPYPLGDASTRRAIREAHKQYMLQFFDVLATDAAIPAAIRAAVADVGLCADEFAAGGGWPEQLYVREVLRLVGDRVLAQGDIWGGATPADFGAASIGLGSYAADGHYAQRGPCIAYNDSGGAPRCRMATSEAEIADAAARGVLWTGGEGYVGATSASELYQIPYFALLPRRQDAQNLLSPTCPSASHVVFASLRVEPTFMVMGHAAGVAAAQAVKAGIAVQDVPVSSLHAELAREGAVLCHKNYPNC